MWKRLIVAVSYQRHMKAFTSHYTQLNIIGELQFKRSSKLFGDRWPPPAIQFEVPPSQKSATGSPIRNAQELSAHVYRFLCVSFPPGTCVGLLVVMMQLKHAAALLLRTQKLLKEGGKHACCRLNSPVVCSFTRWIFCVLFKVAQNLQHHSVFLCCLPLDG